MAKKSIEKWQYGDFQTPIELARKVVTVLKQNHGIEPDVVIEPTCGRGTFLLAAYEEFTNADILGFEIKNEYVAEANALCQRIGGAERVSITEADFFEHDWHKVLSHLHGYVLFIGNPPWVTNSELSILKSQNLPKKSNFQHRRGIDAMTGSGNFDISEWILLQHVNWLSRREGAMAFLCKYAVARKVMGQVRKSVGHGLSGHIYRIDTKAYFDAAVEACLFILTTDRRDGDCEVYESLAATTPSWIIGERDGFIVSNVNHYQKWRHLRGQERRYIWRTGVKHDCAKVMELTPSRHNFINGFEEQVKLEKDYIYPLLKSSDVGNGRIATYRKVVLITQKRVGEDTSGIREVAPNTWNYLLKYRALLAQRKSVIYQNRPEFSMFGIGPYSFRLWKIAISGLYKRLQFNLVGPLDGRPVVFDDTVNFLSFDTEAEAKFIYHLITSQPSIEFLESMIFWDEKRPITTKILKRLSLKEIASELGLLEQYEYWARSQPLSTAGQLELGIG